MAEGRAGGALRPRLRGLRRQSLQSGPPKIYDLAPSLPSKTSLVYSGRVYSSSQA
jgi:hypothetical protein